MSHPAGLDAGAGVVAALHRFANAWKALDPVAVIDCFEDSATTTVIGTDPGEYHRGRDSYAAIWPDRPSHLVVHAFDWVEAPHVEVDGDIAWAHGLVNLDVTSDATRRTTATLWVTAVLRRRSVDAPWAIAHLHSSYSGAPITTELE